MSDLVYQNYNNKCQGWINPANLVFGPQITSLSSYQSPAGSSTVVAINGTNFYSYSTISFGILNPTVYFVNSNIIQFYVPNSILPGTYPVQVFNASVGSNIVNYTIDNASGYWLLKPNGSISNTNTSSTVSVTSLSRGIPILLDSAIYNSSNPYIVQPTDNWLICDTTANIFVLTLPNTNNFIGREIIIKRIGTPYSDLLNTEVNVYSFDNTIIQDIIMSSDVSPMYNWSWVTLVFNGSQWVTMQAA